MKKDKIYEIAGLEIKRPELHGYIQISKYNWFELNILPILTGIFLGLGIFGPILVMFFKLTHQ